MIIYSIHFLVLISWIEYFLGHCSMFSQCFLSELILIITTFDEQVTAKQLEPLITPRYYHACATYNLGHTQVLIENWDHETQLTRQGWKS